MFFSVSFLLSNNYWQILAITGNVLILCWRTTFCVRRTPFVCWRWRPASRSPGSCRTTTSSSWWCRRWGSAPRTSRGQSLLFSIDLSHCSFEINDVGSGGSLSCRVLVYYAVGRGLITACYPGLMNICPLKSTFKQTFKFLDHNFLGDNRNYSMILVGKYYLGPQNWKLWMTRLK